MRDDARGDHLHVPIPATTAFGVGRVDRRTMHTHADVARTGLGIRHLADLQHLLGGTFAVVVGGFHGVLPIGWPDRIAGWGPALARDADELFAEILALEETDK